MRISENEELREIFKYLGDNKAKMSPSQTALIASFKKCFKKYKKLSDRQMGVILDIKNNLR